MQTAVVLSMLLAHSSKQSWCLHFFDDQLQYCSMKEIFNTSVNEWCVITCSKAKSVVDDMRTLTNKMKSLQMKLDKVCYDSWNCLSILFPTFAVS